MAAFRYTRPDSSPPVVKNLVILNCLVYLTQVILDKQYAITDKLKMWPLMPQRLHDLLVKTHNLDEADKFQPYQVVTHMFTHAPPPMFYHILFNMVTLWIFGRVLENVWGAKRFLLFYLACGLGAAALHLGVQYFRCEQLLQAYDNNNIEAFKSNIGAVSAALGASGAIMGVMAAFAFLFPNTELMMLFLPIPIKAKYFILGLVLIDLFGGVSNTGDNIAHFAHLGGAITGFIIVLIWNKTNRRTFY